MYRLGVIAMCLALASGCALIDAIGDGGDDDDIIEPPCPIGDPNCVDQPEVEQFTCDNAVALGTPDFAGQFDTCRQDQTADVSPCASSNARGGDVVAMFFIDFGGDYELCVNPSGAGSMTLVEAECSDDIVGPTGVSKCVPPDQCSIQSLGPGLHFLHWQQDRQEECGVVGVEIHQLALP